MPVDLATLNEGQLQAVHSPIDKPTLVIAGAGSGKTTTLTARLEHVVSTDVDPGQVVAMTFTRKAAGEMAERLEGGPAEAVWSGTIHSFAYARLRAYREAVSEPPLQVLAHPKPHVRRLMGRPSEGYEEAVRDVPELDLSAVLGRIGHWQNELIDPQAAVEGSTDWLDRWAARVYDAYTRWKRRTLRADFGDMLGMAIDAYTEDSLFLAGDRARYHYALVDELQDTNTAQWRLCQLLWEGRPLFGVGDPRQAIYEWRGARPDQLLSFADLWPGVEIIRLVDNYRSTSEIIDAAEDLMEGTVEASASGRLQPTRGPGIAPILMPVSDQREEADYIATAIKERFEMGWTTSGGDISILYRTNAQSVDLEDELAKRQIPYQVVGSKGFWARSEVLALLAYLQLGEDPDDREAFARALMAPSRYLGRAFVDAAAKMADEKGWPVTEACGHVISYSSRRMHPGQLDAAADFTSLIHSLASLPPGAALERVLQKTEFRSWLRRDQGSSDGADDDKDDVVSKLVSVAEMFDSRAALLEHSEKMAARSSSGSKPDPKKVQLLTVHRAKGLEWPVVFVAGFSDGLLPHYKGNPDEERRLAYVAMTRARDQLTLVSPLSTFRGDTSISPFAFDAGLVTPPGEVA